MVKFHLSFVCSFKLPNTAETPVQTPEHVIQVNKPFGMMHVEYELVPKLIYFKFDVLCWKRVAKIFCTTGTEITKTIVNESKVWVVFTTTHELEVLTIDQLRELQAHVINFKIVETKNSLGPYAKNDLKLKSQKFYLKSEDVNNEWFAPAFLSDPNEEMFEPEYGTQHTDMGNWCKIHKDIIIKSNTGEKIKTKPFVPAITKGKPNIPKKSDLLVCGELLFTDPNYSICKYQGKKNTIIDFFVIFLVENLMTVEQKLTLNPLVIKLKKLSNFPAEELIRQGFVSLTASYEIPNLVQCVTAPKPITEKIYFQESHIFFTGRIPNQILREYLFNRLLAVHIKGVRVIPKKPGVIFGDLKEDPTIYKIKKGLPKLPEEEAVELAIANFDVSSILKNVWIYKEKVQCHAPSATLYYPPKVKFEYTIRKNIQEINLIKRELPSYIKESSLLSMGTVIKLEAFAMFLSDSTTIYKFDATFKRLFLIIGSRSTAHKFFNVVFRHNHGVFKKRGQDVITGFMIVNFTDCCMFLEGLACGYVLEIWYMIQKSPETDLKCFIDTSLVFHCRLYPNLVSDTGVYVLALGQTLPHILRKHEIYLKGNVPAPCLEALKKLDMLLMSTTFKTMVQQNLFPTSLELMSLNYEFGVPLKWEVSKIAVGLRK
ncbi:uncharacterized protein LOC126265498 [Aethina tumida]|uniref:uncharacterized protein LOC126265498 n=1 Tax=Aethina tumida TaxID=116153 RepID=UPI002147B35A|nr:uncharacterized protein LOC126265498 [Aethina tumida]